MDSIQYVKFLRLMQIFESLYQNQDVSDVQERLSIISTIKMDIVFTDSLL